MYNFLLNVTGSKKKAVFDEYLINMIKKACEEANSSTNSLRYGRTFSYESQIDEHTVQLRLLSDTSIVATRAISSITRALIRICPQEKLESLKYNSSLLTATIVEEHEEGIEVYSNMDPCEIVQSVIEIFFGQKVLGNNDKKFAKDAAKQIKKIVMDYKNNTRQKDPVGTGHGQ